MKTLKTIFKWVVTALVAVVLVFTGAFLLLALPIGLLMGFAMSDGMTTSMNKTFKNHR